MREGRGSVKCKDRVAKAKMRELSARTPYLDDKPMEGISSFLNKQLPADGGIFKRPYLLLDQI